MARASTNRLGRLGRGLGRRLAYVVPAALLGLAVVLRVYDPAPLQQIRNYAFDALQRVEPRPWRPDTVPVRIVDIDDASLTELKLQWPWPRTKLAELVDKLTAMDAAAILFDVVFSEPDRTSPTRTIGEIARYVDDDTANELRFRVVLDHDQEFAKAIARSGRVVLGFGQDAGGVKSAPVALHRVAYSGDDARRFLDAPQGTVKNLEQLERAAKGLGSIMTDIEDVIRYVPTFFRVAGSQDIYPSLALEGIRVFHGAVAGQIPSTYIVKGSNASDTQAFGRATGISAVQIGRAAFPTTAKGAILLYDTGSKKERFVSVKDVLAGTADPASIAGHIVLIGSSATGLKDLRNTPLGSAVPGVEVHAQLLEQMLLHWLGPELLSAPDAPAYMREMVQRAMLSRPDFADGVETIYLAVLGLLFLFLLPRLSARWMAALAVLGAGVAVLGPWLLFRMQGWLFDPIYPSATLAAIYVTGSSFGFMQAEADRRHIRDAFGLYLSPDLVAELARNPDRLQLGGELRELTVMFTDVRGFTTISEQFDPQGLTRFMNRFLTPMTDLILARRGTVDKYMGDAIMAFWNAPLDVPGHAAMACDTALAMQAALTGLNADWKAEAEREGRRHIPVRVGVGLNTGVASVGNFGSEQRFTYSVLGDDVNLASRLEGQCKTYGVDVIVGEKTRLGAPEHAALEIDLIMVKGKTEPARIFALLGDPAFARGEGFQALEQAQAEFLAAYREGAWGRALARLDAAAEAGAAIGWTPGYFDMMRERIGHLAEDPPPGWNGVFVAKEK